MSTRRKTKSRKTYENWETVRGIVEDQALTVRVEYFEADLLLSKSERVIPRVHTTAVCLWGQDHDGTYHRFVGVSQVGPGDDFLREHGRDVAAGRALKALRAFTRAPGTGDGQLYVSNDGRQEAIVHGKVPEFVDLSDVLLFEQEHRRA